MQRRSALLLLGPVLSFAPCAAQNPEHLRIDTEAQMRALYAVILKFHEDSSRWPTTLTAACDAYSPENCELLDKGEAPIDFWGLPVYYARQPDGFEIRSLGPDRKPGTSDDLVLSYPLDRLLARRIGGCYQPTQGWWTSGTTPIRLDTLPPVRGHVGSYALSADVPGGVLHFIEWFPVTADSAVLQWAQGTRLHMLRLQLSGDTLKGRVDSGDVDWSGYLRLVRTKC